MDEVAGFGKLLRRYRERAGLSQEALAERAGLTVHAVSALERGLRRRPYPNTLRTLADALGLMEADRAALAAAIHQPTVTTSVRTAAAVIPSAPTGNLPAPLTSLIGRSDDLAALAGRLESARLVTLTGPGGSGKTRLALETARAVSARYPDGVWLVDLAPVTDASRIAPAIAATLGVRETAGRSLAEALRTSLAQKQLLLVLDNFEQVLAGASLVSELLRTCPALTVLATSRMRLQLYGEYEYRVPPLPLPDTHNLPPPEVLRHYPAVALFNARAEAADAAFKLTAEHGPAVAAICVQLDGLPLAIELAAARLRALPPATLLARLRDSLPGTRLRLLAGGARDLPARHHTLREAIAWSYDLLTPEDQCRFRRLSVFAGGWTAMAATWVCEPSSDAAEAPAIVEDEDDGVVPPDWLERLYDHALVTRADSDGARRYRLLETIRAFALDQLTAAGEAEPARARHAAWFLALAEISRPHLTDPDPSAWLARLDRETDNLRVALAWGEQAAGSDVSVRLAGLLRFYWFLRGRFTEGRRALGAALTRNAAPATRARLLGGAALLAVSQGDHSAAQAAWEELLSLQRDLGDRAGEAAVLNNFGNLAYEQGDIDTAWTRYQEALVTWRELGDTHEIALTLSNLGMVKTRQGDQAAAVALHAESLALFRSLGERRYVANVLDNLAAALNESGAYIEAQARYQEALAVQWDMDDRRGIVFSLVGLAGAAAASVRPERAARLLAGADALCETLGLGLPVDTRRDAEKCTAAVRMALGEETFADAWTEGRALPLDQIVALALED
jgi:predicted ATPase/DNA-binding XRE family transcriptional regulator